jgi:hypothetical protein
MSNIELRFPNFILDENVFSGELATSTTKVESRKDFIEFPAGEESG